MRGLLIACAAALGVVVALWLKRAPAPQPALAAPVAETVPTRASTPVKRRALRAPLRQMQAAANDGGVNPDIVGSMDPTAPGYDPVVLARVTDESPKVLFDKEPRVPAFADRREADLRDRVIARLRKRLPFDVKVETECHTSSCRLTVQPNHDGDDLNAALQALDLGGLAETALISPGRDDAGAKLDTVLLYGADDRDEDDYGRRLKQHEAHDADAH